MARLLCASNRASVSEGPALAFYGLICLAAAVTTSRKTTFSIFVRETSAVRSLAGLPSLSPPTLEDIAERRRASRLLAFLFLFFFFFCSFRVLLPVLCLGCIPVGLDGILSSAGKFTGTKSPLPSLAVTLDRGNACLVENDRATRALAPRVQPGSAYCMREREEEIEECPGNSRLRARKFASACPRHL